MDLQTTPRSLVAKGPRQRYKMPEISAEHFLYAKDVSFHIGLWRALIPYSLPVVEFLLKNLQSPTSQQATSCCTTRELLRPERPAIHSSMLSRDRAAPYGIFGIRSRPLRTLDAMTSFPETHSQNHSRSDRKYHRAKQGALRLRLWIV
jgi:hypothetical protein